jgi:threonine/homoserine/homoserine lactone efflux protein
MIDPAVLPGFLAAVFLVALAPGPDNTYIAAVALARGARAGLVSAAGMSLGMVVHVCAAALGLAVLLRSAPEALVAVRLLGAAYLGWLAVTTLRSASRDAGEPSADPGASLLWRAALTNLTNPKVVIFFAAFLPQFTRPEQGSLAFQLLTLGLIFLLVGLVCDVVVGISAGRLGRLLGAGGGAARALTVVAGLTFAVLSLLLLVEAATG